MARCNICNKFTGVDAEGEPEVLEVDIEDKVITLSVLITNLCAECGEPLKEYTFEIEHEIEVEEGPPHELEVDTTSVDRIEKTVKGKKHYGFCTVLEVRCLKCDFREVIGIEDSVPASEMDSL